VKATKPRAPRKQQSIDDFSESEWEKVTKIILEEAAEWTPELTVKIEVSASAPTKAELKRSHDVLSSDPIE